MRAGSWGPQIAIVVLSVWLGGALLAIGAVAPAAFAVLPSRTIAGAMVGRVLSVVFVSGIAAAIISVLCEASLSLNAFSLKVSGPLIALAAGCAIAQFVITPRIEKIRIAVGGPLDGLDVHDPRRMQFGRLHAFSVAWLAVAMLGAAIAIGMQVRAIRHPLTLSFDESLQLRDAN